MMVVFGDYIIMIWRYKWTWFEDTNIHDMETWIYKEL